MTNPKRVLLLGFATLAVVGCQTIREELPNAPTATNGSVTGGASTGTIPVVVVPVPIPAPQTGPATPTTPSNPTPSTPSTPNNPNPNPTPRPTPGPANPNNNSATVRIGAKVFFVERNGQVLPESEFATSVQVGDRIHFDATAKDAQNLPTTTHGSPHWTFTNGGIISVSGGGGDWTPVAIAKSGGSFSAYVEADGIRSNTLTISIH